MKKQPKQIYKSPEVRLHGFITSPAILAGSWGDGSIDEQSKNEMYDL